MKNVSVLWKVQTEQKAIRANKNHFFKISVDDCLMIKGYRMAAGYRESERRGPKLELIQYLKRRDNYSFVKQHPLMTQSVLIYYAARKILFFEKAIRVCCSVSRISFEYFICTSDRIRLFKKEARQREVDPPKQYPLMTSAARYPFTTT